MSYACLRSKARIEVSQAFICYYVFLLTLTSHIPSCWGHGRLIEPPSRASAWRYGFQTPPDYNDHELYCGGFTRQWKRNGGKCGECGDPWDVPQPRPHEHGGQWGQGVIVRKYKPGSEMTIRVELTASHMGYFEFRLCPDPDAKQNCLDRYLLKLLGGAPSQPSPTDLDTRFYPRNGSRIYEIKAQLPSDLKCDNCVLQWRYVAGNNWGMCPDGNGAVGCGPQEEFRSCSDIALGEGAYTPRRPIRPTLRTTVRPKTDGSEPPTQQEESSESSDYMPVLIILVILFVLLCALGIWFVYRRYNKKIKEWMMSVVNNFYSKQTKNVLKSSVPVSNSSMAYSTGVCTKEVDTGYKADYLSAAPVPPPRTKRQTRVKELSADEFSVA